MRRIFIAALLLVGPALSQKLDPVQWSLAAEPLTAAPGSVVPLKLTARIDPGWHH